MKAKWRKIMFFLSTVASSVSFLRSVGGRWGKFVLTNRGPIRRFHLSVRGVSVQLVAHRKDDVVQVGTSKQ